MEQNTIAEVSEETLKIQAFLEEQPEGATLTYTEIALATDVPMDAKGKARLRSALKRMSMDPDCIRGHGIRLPCPQNAMMIVARKAGSVNNAINRLDACHNRIQTAFLERLPQEQRMDCLRMGAALGALKLTCKNMKRLYSKTAPKLSPAHEMPVLISTHEAPAG